MRLMRLFATSPRLPDCPFAKMADWAEWVKECVAQCKDHRTLGYSVVLLPEAMNLPVITTGSGWRMFLARWLVSRGWMMLAMLVVGGWRAITSSLAGVAWAEESKLKDSLRVYRQVAQDNSCYIVACGFFVDTESRRLVNRLWVIAPSGEVIHVYDKQRLTRGEQGLRVVAGQQYNNPFFEIEGVSLAAVVCYDMFDPNIQHVLLGSDMRALLVPSANSLPWAGYAKSGVWQPLEWLAPLKRFMARGIMVINSMLRGSYGNIFDGEPSICGPNGTSSCEFPDNNGLCPMPEIGFYPNDGNVVWADLEVE